jgi:hypothetical protein
MKTTHTSVDTIKEAQDYVDYSKKRMATVRKNAKKLDATLDLLNRRCALVDEFRATLYTWTTTNIYDQTIGIEAQITATTDSMIEGIVPQILKAMLDMECEPTGSEDQTTSVSAQRTYQFKRAASEHFLSVNVNVIVRIEESDTGTCRKVQIGTKMVEIGEYKIECTGGAI